MQDDKVYRIQRGALAIEVIEYGARLKRCLVPDAAGNLADVVPGFSHPSDYAARGGTMGAVLGRYGNRIGHGRIAIHGTEYQLSRNDGEHTMHGGAGHFGTRWWTGTYNGPYSIVLELVSEDGDQGWPGTMTARVNYTLTENGELQIDMEAICDRDTFVNMLFHGYWNLAGHGSGSVHAHLLKIAATRYTPKGPDGLPTGELAPVEGTPFDFRQPKAVGANIAATGNGYAHNLCLQDTGPEIVRPVAWMVDPRSGRALILKTDQPGVQLFTANSWSNLAGKDGAVYNAHSGLALETQLYPNTPNTPQFSPRLLRSGGVYRHRMVIGFSSLRASEIEDFFETDL